jgi:hypothetical protein
MSQHRNFSNYWKKHGKICTQVAMRLPKDFIVRRFQIKCMFSITNNAIEQILHLFCL